MSAAQKSDNVMIVESGEVSARHQAMYELAIEQIKELRQERDLYFNQLSDSKRNELTNAVKFEVIKRHLFNMLSAMEAYHEQNGKFESWLQSAEYCEAAKAARTIGRGKGKIVDIVAVVEEQMKDM